MKMQTLARVWTLGCRSINQSAKRRRRQKTTKLAALEVIYARQPQHSSLCFLPSASRARLIRIAHSVPHAPPVWWVVIKKAPSPRERVRRDDGRERECLLINFRSRGWRRRLCGSVLFPHDIVSRFLSACEITRWHWASQHALESPSSMEN
jgi:hypothetical protein